MRSFAFSKLIVTAVAVLGFVTAAHGQVPSLYLPQLQASDAADLGLALSNPTLSEVTVTLTARTYSGTTISGDGITNPVTLTLPAQGQRALRTVEIFGTAIAGQTGWVEIQASTAAVRGFYLLFDSALSFIDGTDLTKTPVSRLTFPKLTISPDSTSTISYVHVGTGSLNRASLSLFDNSGNVVGRKLLALEPLSGFSGPLSTLFPEVGTFDGYAVLQSSGTPFTPDSETLVGLETYRERSDVAILQGFADGSRVRKGYLAHLASRGGYVTRLGLVNSTFESQTVNITAQGLMANGQSLSPSSVTVSRTIAGFGRLEESAESLFNLTGNDLITGYIVYEVTGDTNGLMGYLDYGTSNGVLLSAVPGQGTGFSDLFFSHIAEGLGFYTGIALLNPTTQTASVTMDVFDSAGQRRFSKVLSLASGERIAQLMSELFPGFGDQLGGYLRVTSSRPIFAFQLFGSRTSLDFLANVSAQGVQLQPQASGRVVSVDSGANVIAADGAASIAIPPGALSTDTAITLGPVSIATLPPPSATQSLVAAVVAEPSGTKFEIPVKLTFPLSAQLAPGTEVAVLIFNPTTNQFEATEFVGIVDESGRTASADVTHFTTFGVGLSKDKLVEVTGVTPDTGVAGTEAVIAGSGFSTDPAANKVTFAGIDNTVVTAQVTAATATSLTLKVPTGAVTGNVIVEVGDKTSVGVTFTVPVDNPVPSLTSLTPTSAAFGSTTVDIQLTGTGFRSDSTVQYDGTSVTVSFVDSTLLLVTVSGSQLDPAVHEIKVTNPTPGGGESNTVEFTVGFSVPTISSLTPATAEIPNPIEVKIVGTGFTTSSTVLFNSQSVGGTFVSETEMNATLSSTAVGASLVSVSNPSPGGGESNPATFLFTEPPIGFVVVISVTTTTGTVNTTSTAILEVRDTAGDPLPEIDVTILVKSGNGSASPSTLVSDAFGRVTTVLMIGTTAGSNVFAGKAGRIESDPITITGTPDVPTKAALSANPTSFTAGSSGSTITAQIQDQFSNLVTGATNGVAFSVSAGSGALSVGQATTGGITSVTLTSTVSGTTTITGVSSGLTTGIVNVTVSPASPSSVTATGGTGQTGQAGVALGTAFEVQVKDTFGNVNPGVTVTFAVVSGGGSITPTTATTDSNGEASATATAGGTLGTQTFTATFTALTAVTFNVTVSPGPPTKLALETSTGTVTAGGTPANLTVTIQDQFGNTVTAASNTVTFSASPNTSVTFGAIGGPTNGIVTSTFVSTSATTFTVTAASTGLTSSNVGNTVVAAAASQITVVSGNNQSAVKSTALASSLVAQVSDQFGNPVSGVSVTFSVTSGNGLVSPAIAQTTGSNGQVSATATAGSVGTVTDTFAATSIGLTGSPLTFSATVLEASPTAITQVGTIGSTAIVATTTSLTVLVTGAGSVPVPNVNVAFASTAGGGSVSSAAVTTGQTGQATVTLTLGNTVGTNTFTASVVGVSTPTTVTITGTAAAASQITKSSGDAQTGTASTALTNPLVVEVQDQFGNVVSGTTVTFASTSGNSTISTTSGASDSNGHVSTAVTLGSLPGTHTFSATSGGLTNSPLSFSATVNAATPTGVVAVGSVASSGTVATTVVLTVQVNDSEGNPVPFVTVAFAKTAGNGAVSTATGTTNALGQAVVTLTLGNTAGTNTYTATVSSVTPLSVSVTGTAGSATLLTKVSGDAQTGQAGADLASALVVQVSDQFTNPVSGVGVMFYVSSGGGSVSVTTVQTTGASGQVSVTATLGTVVGADTFTAASFGLTSVVYTANVQLTASTIALVTGNNQAASAGISLLVPLKVKVTNTGNQAVPNVTVNWAAATGGGSVSAATSVTDASGQATIVATLGGSNGTNTFTATVSGLSGSPVTFTGTAKTLTITPATVDVTIASGSTVIGGYQVTINYDPTVVQVQANTNVSGGTGAGFTGNPTTINFNDTAGTLTLNTFQMGNLPDGNFTVAQVTFIPIRGGPVTLTTSGVAVVDTEGEDVSAAFLSLSSTSLTVN